MVTGTVVWWRTRSSVQLQPSANVVATLRTEPESFNRLVTASAAVDAITPLIHAPLIKVDRTDGTLMPWLADRWEALDSTRYRLHLRRDIRFSDGTPFTADDVRFTFEALYDPRVASALGSGLRIGGVPLTLTVEDAHTVLLEFPVPYGPGLAMLDVLPILPRHRLEASLRDGRFAQAWTPSTPPEEIVGLGPFVVEAVSPGESVSFVPNPHYFRRAEDGSTLPRAPRIIVRVVPDQSAEMVQLESGAAHFGTGGLRAEDLAAFRTLEQQDRVRLHDVGVALDPNALWFNLAEGARPATARPWLQRRELRHAISRAVSRTRIVDTVYLGAAQPVMTPVTPGHGAWHAGDVEPHAHDPVEAARLLDSIGLRDRDGDGMRDDASGRTARIALLTQRGHTIRERTAAIIQEDLARVGIGVDIVALEVGSLIARIGSGDYDAVLFGLQASGVDPAVNLDFWLPEGVFHFWNPAQREPAADWERRIAELMVPVVNATDRDTRLTAFHEVQRVFARELPAIYFAAPRVVLATSSRLQGVRPSLLQPHVLWMPDELRVEAR